MRRRLLKGLVWFFLSFFTITCGQVICLRFFNPPFTAFMLWDWLGNERRFKLRLNWKPLPEISINMAKAVLAAEDQRFYQHGGFDWVEVRQAVGQSVQGTGLRGASTISMQAAR
ncbi:MAG: transglycosylase domain-containing protein, partial [Pseudomonadota bacterium]